jgi:putative DNA methylase
MSNSDVLQESPLRQYDRRTSVVFLKTKEAFGGLSNMAAGFPIRVNGVRVLTSEALYQACRFPHRPEIQRLIIEQTSPMTAKMKGKPHRDDTRPDWDSVRVRIMRWCLRAKLVQNFWEFSRLLLATGTRPIVEESRKDDFWGAKADETGGLLGQNVLGRLLMELREEVRSRPRDHWDALAPLAIPNFWFLGEPMPAIESSGRNSSAVGQVAVPREAHRPEPTAQPIVNETKKVTPPRKKLIEVSLPLEAINVASAREKSIRHGHPSTLHLWWARRPLAACRAVLFAQLVDDPSAWPGRYPFPEIANDEEAERKRLHRIIERMVPWEASNDEAILNEARWEIARSVAWGLGEEPPARDDGRAILDYLQTKAPPVYDPFSGGGSIPLEAQRLGLRACGSDLNPVAVLIGKALVEIPPKFAGLPPVNPKARAEAAHGQLRAWKGAQGLAEDVRYYGQWMRDEAERRIGKIYPAATLNDGSNATVIAWLWARTVRSPDPAAKGALVPLISSYIVSNKEKKKVWIKSVIDQSAPDGYRFTLEDGLPNEQREAELSSGTKSGRGTFTCILTGASIPGDYIKSEFQAGRSSSRLMCMVVESTGGRKYLPPDPRQEAAAMVELPDVDAIAQDVAKDPRALTPILYSLDRFDKLFTNRQLVALTTFSDLVGVARENALAHASLAGLKDDTVGLHAGGTGAAAYADAIATYLAFAVDKAADRNTTLCAWETKMDRMRNTFGRQALSMVWDFTETNPLSGAGGDIAGTAVAVFEVLSKLNFSGFGSIANINASRNSFPIRPIVISTDPPYYDNIGYADLSDFFYVWLRRSLVSVWPDLFRRLAAPKEGELVALSYRHNSKEKAEAYFMNGMGEALAAMRKASTDPEPLTIYYAFKQSELVSEGIVSAGWASFLQAVVDAGLVVDGTWPMRTELASRMRGLGSNALASSIVLVCRKRADGASTATRSEFLRALKRDMPDAVDKIRKAGVGPVDMPQSVIGPGMGVFTRYTNVLEDDDSLMGVKTALALINRVWGEIENDLDANFDPETQVALAWFATYGFDARASGDLITLANAKNIPIESLFRSGVFENLHGKAGLIPRERLDRDWSPATDKTVTIWECVQHTARVLRAEDGGAEAAAKLVAAMGAKAEDARALAYRLYEIASQKAWAAEALVYNELAQEWAHLDTLAADMSRGARGAAPARDLFGEIAR